MTFDLRIKQLPAFVASCPPSETYKIKNEVIELYNDAKMDDTRVDKLVRAAFDVLPVIYATDRLAGRSVLAYLGKRCEGRQRLQDIALESIKGNVKKLCDSQEEGITPILDVMRPLVHGSKLREAKLFYAGLSACYEMAENTNLHKPMDVGRFALTICGMAGDNEVRQAKIIEKSLEATRQIAFHSVVKYGAQTLIEKFTPNHANAHNGTPSVKLRMAFLKTALAMADATMQADYNVGVTLAHHIVSTIEGREYLHDVGPCIGKGARKEISVSSPHPFSGARTYLIAPSDRNGETIVVQRPFIGQARDFFAWNAERQKTESNYTAEARNFDRQNGAMIVQAASMMRNRPSVFGS